MTEHISHPYKGQGDAPGKILYCHLWIRQVTALIRHLYLQFALGTQQPSGYIRTSSTQLPSSNRFLLLLNTCVKDIGMLKAIAKWILGFVDVYL
jgi:hypothetical protein